MILSIKKIARKESTDKVTELFIHINETRYSTVFFMKGLYRNISIKTRKPGAT